MSWSEQEVEMNELNREIARLEEAIDRYNSIIPSAEGASLATFLFHREWDLRIIADLERVRVRSAIISR